MLKKNKIRISAIHSLIVAVGVCFSLVLGGCASLRSSSPARFYTLQPVSNDEVNKIINISPDLLIGVGPIRIPQYLDRPQMVTTNKNRTLQFAQFDRWAESLDNGVARLIREDLTARLPAAKFVLYPWKSSIPVNYRVGIEITRLDSELDKDLYFVAQWVVMDETNRSTVMIKRTELRQPIIPQDYAGLAATLSTVCTSLSSEIAVALATLEIQS